MYLKKPKYSVKVFTNYKNLLYFITTKVLNRRQVRWSESFSIFNFTISYTKEKENAKTDALSRRPDYEERNKKYTGAILRQNTYGIVYNYQTIAVMYKKLNNDVLEIQKAYEKDLIVKQVLAKPEKYSGFTKNSKEILLFHDLVYVLQT